MKESWAQRYSNNEKEIFQKGNWSLTEDGEKVWSLYNKGICVSPVLDYNKYILFKNGFLLYIQDRDVKTFSLYSAENDTPIFQSSGEDFSFEINDNLLIFNNKIEQTIFDIDTLAKININNEDQLGLSL